jgi:hypothetical protein
MKHPRRPSKEKVYVALPAKFEAARRELEARKKRLGSHGSTSSLLIHNRKETWSTSKRRTGLDWHMDNDD